MAAHGSIEAEARAYLHDALCLLYDLADREVTGRALRRAGERRARLESELWRRSMYRSPGRWPGTAGAE